MFGLGSIYDVFFTSSEENNEEVSEESFEKETKLDIESSVCNKHEGGILAQSGDVIHSAEIDKLKNEVLDYTYNKK